MKRYALVLLGALLFTAHAWAWGDDPFEESSPLGTMHVAPGGFVVFSDGFRGVSDLAGNKGRRSGGIVTMYPEQPKEQSPGYYVDSTEKEVTEAELGKLSRQKRLADEKNFAREYKRLAPELATQAHLPTGWRSTAKFSLEDYPPVRIEMDGNVRGPLNCGEVEVLGPSHDPEYALVRCRYPNGFKSEAFRLRLREVQEAWQSADRAARTRQDVLAALNGKPILKSKNKLNAFQRLFLPKAHVYTILQDLRPYLGEEVDERKLKRCWAGEGSSVTILGFLRDGDAAVVKYAPPPFWIPKDDCPNNFIGIADTERLIDIARGNARQPEPASVFNLFGAALGGARRH